MSDMDHYSGNSHAFRLGLRGRCPRCEQGKLFNGYLALAKSCDRCGLDYSFADPADGPAFFAMSIWAVPALGFGMWIQMAFDPPSWVHLLTTGPVLILGCMALLRPLKGWLVCSQYIHKAEQGRLSPRE
ncbi:membrane protein [Agaricicola taiwanensis]|uniref:Membrane protein n=2 Tax=Agaricicola taiwanensis TaxID=591372 RepID=A0A8J3E0Y9_9RHOB|nr:membrane protein [Agaricicola taiwanensis]